MNRRPSGGGDMTARTAHAGVMALVLALVAACGSDATSVSTTSTPVTSATSSIETTTPVESTVAPSTSTEPAEQAAAFPVAAFAAISEEPVTDELAAKLQSALEGLAARREMAEKGGMSATVMTADGTWSGTTGTADGVRDLQIDDQFAIASITKSVVATQVMLMVEAGELGLDDLAADHLPPDLGSYTNGATIRQLLSHRSGLRDYYDTTFPLLGAEPARVWTLADVLEVLPAPRGAAGDSFEYSGTNYLLLGLVIEQLSGRPVAEVLRDGALDMDGVERLVYQPDESPTEPMAMPGGRSTDALELGGGFLPSVASASAHTAEGGIASDSPSLARWWRAFCAGEIVSPATLTEMSAFDPDVDEAYGLGLFNPAHGYTRGTVGHQGAFGDFSYTAWAACLPEDGAVMVVLSNRPVDMSYELFYGMLRPFVEVLRSG